MDKKITLVFDKNNNFDQLQIDNNTSDKSDNIVKNVLWFINCAQLRVESAYQKNSPRYIEINKLCNNLRKQIEQQLD